MKRYTYLSVTTVIVGMSLLISQLPARVSAACANVSSYGSLTVQLPELANLNNQVVWLRMQTNESGPIRMQAEINEDVCLDISGNQASAAAWGWYAPAGDNGVYQTINFPQATGNTIKLIGIQDAVRLDKIVIASGACVPEGLGENCAAADVAAVIKGGNSYTELSQPQESVKGLADLSQVLAQAPDQVRAVTYLAEGRALQQLAPAAAFDTSLLANGTHTVYIHATLEDDTVVREKITVTVANEEHALSSLIRWGKLHRSALIIAAGVLAVVVVWFALLIVGMRWARGRRDRSLHGI